LIIYPAGRVLMRRRTESLLRGMRVYVLLEKAPENPEPIEDIVSGWGYSIRRTVPLGCASHIFTHRLWEMDGYAVYVDEAPPHGDYAFLTRDEIKKAALPRAVEKYTRFILPPF
jgi:A/G-specific adenine glycosylase